MYRTLPTTLSLELRMQRYDNFLNPPNFRRSFFESLIPVSGTYYIYVGVPRSHLRRHLLYIGVPRSLSRRHLLYIGVPRSHLRGHLLYIVSYPLGPEVSTKKLTSSTLIVKTCSPLKALQTPPKTRSFELRVQR